MNYLAGKEIEQMIKSITANKTQVTTNLTANVTLKDGAQQQKSINQPIFIGKQAEYNLNINEFTLTFSNIKYMVNNKTFSPKTTVFTLNKESQHVIYYIYGANTAPKLYQSKNKNLSDILIQVVYIPSTATKITKNYTPNEGFVVEAPVAPMYHELVDFIYSISDIVIASINNIDTSLLVGDITANRWLSVSNQYGTLKLLSDGLYFYDKNNNLIGTYTADEIKIGDTIHYLKYTTENGLEISGNISTTTGNIGGWDILTDKLTSSNIILDSTNSQIIVKSGTTNVVKIGKNVVNNDTDGIYINGGQLQIDGTIKNEYLDVSKLQPQDVVLYFSDNIFDVYDNVYPIGYDAIEIANNVLVNGINIVQDAITATHITDGSILTPKIQTNAITSDKIIANAITSEKILQGSITSSKIAQSAITATHIQAGAIKQSNIDVTDLFAQDIEINNSGNIHNTENSFRLTQDGIYYYNSSGVTISEFTSTSAKVGGWNISNNVLSSTNINIDSNKERLEILDSGILKIALGYLAGITYTKIIGTTVSISTFTSSDYGLFIRKSNAIHIEAPEQASTVITFVKGDWLVQHDATIQILNSNSNPIISIGQDSNSYGMFLKKDSSTLIAKFSEDGVYYYNSSGTTISSFNLDGIFLQGTIVASAGTIGGWNISANTLGSTGIKLDSYNSKITAGDITIDGQNNSFQIGSKLSYAGGTLSIDGTITSTSGSIGGWNISQNTLSSSNISLDSENSIIKIISGTTDVVKIGKSVTSTNEDGIYISGGALEIGGTIKNEYLEVSKLSPQDVVLYFSDNIFDVYDNVYPIGYDKIELDSNVNVNGINIVQSAITATHISDNQITTPKIQTNAITTDKLSQNQVTAQKIDVSDLFAQEITLTGDITVNSGTTETIKIGNNALGTNNPGIYINGGQLQIGGSIKNEYLQLNKLVPPKIKAYFTKNIFDLQDNVFPVGYDKTNLISDVQIDHTNVSPDSVVADLLAGNEIYAGHKIQVGTGVVIENTSQGAGNIRVTDGTTDIVKIGEDALGTGQPGIAITNSAGNTILSNQFTTQIYNISVIDQIDSSHELDIPIYIPSDVSGTGSASGKARIYVKVEKFRSYSGNVSASGGAHTGLNVDVNVTIGGVTDPAFGNDTSTVGTSNNIDDNTTVTKTTSSNGSHSHTVSIPSHNHSYTDYYEDTGGGGHVLNKVTGTWSGTNVGSGTGGAHTHTLSLPAAHHHTVTKGDFAHSHTLSGANATATASGSVNIPDHTHAIQQGIYENTALTGTVTIKKNGATIGTIDLSSEVIKTISNQSVADGDTIEISSTGLVRITAYLFIQYNLAV